jgi:signal transduction histidine kinase
MDMTANLPALPPPSLPLPPVKKPAPAAKSGRKSLHHIALRGAQSVVQAPGKLIERVNQELYKRNAELAVRNKTLALLRHLDEISLAALELDEMARQMTTAIATELGYELVSIAMVDEEADVLFWLAISSSVPWITTALAEVDVKEMEISLHMDIDSIKALKTLQPTLAEDLHNVFSQPLVEALHHSHDSAERDPVKYSMLQPLRFGDKILGLLTLTSSRSFQEASRYEHESVSGLVGLVSLALYKAKIYQDLQTTSAQLASANTQLKDLDKAKSEFLSIASHQLYTPLTALRGYLSMLREGDFGEINDKQQPIFDILNTSTERLIALIKNLLDISRIESGRLELNLLSVDLVKMIDELVQSLYPNAVHKGLKLTFIEPPKDTPHVVADEQRLRQVLLNFIDNSIKYTEKGKIDVTLRREGDEVIFAVTDTGKGLTPEEATQLFHKFTRVGGASRFHTEGTGLGLYVAKQIVNEHHGDVGVTSPGKNQGSTFSVRLPIEGSAKSLKVGEKTSVVIKAAESK